MKFSLLDWLCSLIEGDRSTKCIAVLVDCDGVSPTIAKSC